jgi:hypothetical protein
MKILSQGRDAAIASTAALVVALGGTSYAAVMITGHDIKNGTVTTADVKDHNLKLKDFSKRAKAGLHGAPGAVGPQGATGAQGPTGPSTVFSAAEASGVLLTSNAAPVLTLALPPGSYVVLGKSIAQQTAGATSTVSCQIFGAGVSGSDNTMAVTTTYATLNPELGFSTSTPTSVTLACDSNTTNTFAMQSRLLAVEVGSSQSQ